MDDAVSLKKRAILQLASELASFNEDKTKPKALRHFGLGISYKLQITN